MSQIQVIVVTPEATVVDAETAFVALPLFDGEMGVAANHAPLIGRLGVGELRFDAAGQTVRYFVDGGFVQIADNVVSIMAGRAQLAAEIDVEQARSQLSAASGETAAGDEQIRDREKKAARARAMVHVGQRS
jgi:F-type H+-transporting ATPase subunit epsilon